jgi:tRNA (guanine-N7-)-methyltransferase
MMPQRDGSDPAHRRTIRSFVRRGGRLTPSQARALDELWPRFGIEPPQPAGPRRPVRPQGATHAGDRLRQRRKPGRTRRASSGARLPGHRGPRSRRRPLLLRIERDGLANIRIARHDAVEVVSHWLPPGSIDETLIFFPDPWHKKRHHKRRLVQPAFLESWPASWPQGRQAAYRDRLGALRGTDARGLRSVALVREHRLKAAVTLRGRRRGPSRSSSIAA